jgi:hypothetical protein
MQEGVCAFSHPSYLKFEKLSTGQEFGEKVVIIYIPDSFFREKFIDFHLIGRAFSGPRILPLMVRC